MAVDVGGDADGGMTEHAAAEWRRLCHGIGASPRLELTLCQCFRMFESYNAVPRALVKTRSSLPCVPSRFWRTW
jgi:hypothetical protein